LGLSVLRFRPIYSLQKPRKACEPRGQDISFSEAKRSAATESPGERFPSREGRRGSHEPTFRKPNGKDGPRISRLIAASPPLDVNSAYCNLLQCTDFRDTCVLAERGGSLIGWVSAYRPPSSPEAIFVWQVAVDPAARGEGLGLRMLDALLARPAVAGAEALTTTITADNGASWALFEAFARRHGAAIQRSPRFERDAHFDGAHETEWQARIAPLPTI
jgi:L-2,4-diaminobutyric acid acetyltransferase